MSAIITDKPRVELFRDLVREGEQRAQQPLDETVESYLVFTLIEHLRDPAIDTQPMALALLDGLDQVGSVRGQHLRAVGDRCLLIAGFYPALAERRLVTPQYYAALGRHAYEELAAAMRASLADLYQSLSGAFDALVRVLAECRMQPARAYRPVLVPVPAQRLWAARTRCH
ncbi:MAG: hypothetical protein HYV17_14525 [Xanthomonadales bacterium]|nr:hypothetical protein [Xanthomonadales bacterium]